MSMTIRETFQAKRIFAKAERILKNMGGEYCIMVGIDSVLFEDFESLNIRRRNSDVGDGRPARFITIKKDDEVVFDAEKIDGVSFETIIYRPGSWTKVLDDEFFATGK